MPLTIRSKMILYTALPVVAVYLLLFAFGVTHVRDHLSRDAQNLLAEHARHQASRLAVLLSQAPTLAESLGDLVAAAPGQQQDLLYAHLIDGLRRTPVARSAAVQFGTPPRSALMHRGAPSARPLRTDENLEHSAGWNVLDGIVGFSRSIYRAGDRIGSSWVTISIDDIYAELERLRSPEIHLVVHHQNGAWLPPSSIPAALMRLATSTTLPGGEREGVQTVRVGNGASYWLIDATVPAHPWHVRAVIPAATALAGVRREVMLFAGALLLSLLVIVVIISAAASQITRPLSTLDDAVQRIAHGDFGVAPDVRSDDELGGLADAIRHMAGHIADREHQLRSSHQALEQRVSERTSALQQANTRLLGQIEETRKTQKALRLANEQAQQANRAKSEFLSNMSHELRTPLHGVLGYAQILRREPRTDNSQRESLDAIERCGQHLLTLINDILDLTKIEAGEMRVEKQATDLPQLVGDVCTIVAQRADQKGLELNRELSTDVPRMIRTDPLKLRQILLNLLGNAVKFTTRGSVVLAVGRDSDGQLAFEVTDSGVGIPADKIDAIFDAFQQAREGQAVDGTGLGLAISQRLIRLLGGEALHVESEPGHGSRFHFRIPFEELADDQEARPAPIDAARPCTRRLVPGQKCRVLVIDESADSRDFLAKLLRDADCEVETLPERADAALQLPERDFDLVLVDVRMPDDALPATAAALRRQAAASRATLIAISANVFPDTVREISEAGFDGFLGKPFSDCQLLDLIETLGAVRFVDLPTTRGSASPLAVWPAALAHTTAERIREAIEMGDVGSLFQLAEDLADEPGAPQTDVEDMALMARMFDFDGLRSLSERLQDNG